MIKILSFIDREPNEMFKLWLKYYLNYFKIEDFIIVDRSGKSDILKNYILNFTKEIVLKNYFELSNKFTIVSNKNNKLIHDSLVDMWAMTNNIRNELISQNITVVGVDPDEFLYNKDLLNYIENVKNCAVSTGFNIIQINESEINWNVPILKQRSLWIPQPYNNKPCIVKSKINNWMLGRHNNTIYKNDENLICLHLRDIDYNYLYNSIKETKILYKDYISTLRTFWKDEKTFNNWFKVDNIKGNKKIPDDIMDNCILNKIFL